MLLGKYNSTELVQRELYFTHGHQLNYTLHKQQLPPPFFIFRLIWGKKMVHETFTKVHCLNVSFVNIGTKKATLLFLDADEFISILYTFNI